jgi:hypothetical protein
MSKIAYFPRASLNSCLELASAVSDLGGNSSTDMAAEKLNKKVSGSFNAIIAATVSFGLISNNRGQLEVTNLFKNLKLAYTSEDEQKELRNAFLNPPLFKAVTERFDNKPLPLSHFEKLLIKEFNIPENYSSRVAKYFIDGAKACGILAEGGVIKINNIAQTNYELTSEEELNQTPQEDEINETKNEVKNNSLAPLTEDPSQYAIHITGPDNLDFSTIIKTKMQLTIVNSILEMIKEALINEEKKLND